MQRLQITACYEEDTAAVTHDELLFTPDLQAKATQSVKDVFVKLLRDAVHHGLSERGARRLQASLNKGADNFRLEFANDPPVKVAPLKVRLKPGVKPIRCTGCRYPPLHMRFLEKHCAELSAVGLIYLNNRSRWCSAPRIVPEKSSEEPRMTVDSRRVNTCTDSMVRPMPVLEIAITHVQGSRTYFSCDWFKGCWQLPLHPASQELFTFITHRGMWTPTRVPMGATDAVAFCQSTVEEIFGPLLYQGLLAWLDDLLGPAPTEEELCDLFDQVMELCTKYGLKLHPGKCVLYTTEIKWCGRMIPERGITHCPDRIQGLIELAPPTTAADLQQFLCAVNWMRASIPDYTTLTAPLYAVLKQAMQQAGSRKKVKLQRCFLAAVGWGANEDARLRRVKDALVNMVPACPPPG